jgi:hypothetical protein
MKLICVSFDCRERPDTMSTLKQRKKVVVPVEENRKVPSIETIAWGDII